MEITIARAGGLTGRTEEPGQIDTAGLPQESARQVVGLVADMNFFALPATITKRGGAEVVHNRTTSWEISSANRDVRALTSRDTERTAARHPSIRGDLCESSITTVAKSAA